MESQIQTLIKFSNPNNILLKKKFLNNCAP